MSAKLRAENASKPRSMADFYETKRSGAICHVSTVKNLLETGDTILDLGFGTGVYGKAIRELADGRTPLVHGIDIRPETETDEMKDIYDSVLIQDFMTHHNPSPYTLIVGNPPYLNVKDYILKALTMIEATRGAATFMLKGSFLESIDRFEGLFKIHKPRVVYQLAQRHMYGNHAEAYILVEFGASPAEYTELKWLRYHHKTEEVEIV